MAEASFTHYSGTTLAAATIECPRSETLTLTITMLTAEGAARDTSDGVVSFNWERRGVLGSPVRVTADGGPSGVHTIALDTLVTVLLDGIYQCDIWYIPPEGPPERLIEKSALSIVPAVGPEGSPTLDALLQAQVDAVRYYAPRVFATCADARANADPADYRMIYVIDRGHFTWTTSAGTDSGTEASRYIAGTGGGWELDTVSYLDAPAGGALAPAYRAGSLYWDGETWVYRTKFSDVTNNIGRELHIPVYNPGATIPDGRAAYAAGGHAHLVDIAAFQNGSGYSGKVLGLTTHDVTGSAEGILTTFGLVNNLNTAGFSDGQEVYTSATPGVLTNVMPTGDVDGARIGIVTNAHATQGSIFVHPRDLPRQGGTTANRPSTPRLFDMYFDTTLGYPVWWNGSTWVDGYPDTWDDVIGPIDFAASVAALTYEAYRDTPAMVSKMRHDQNDALTLRFQMPHGWDLGNVGPHIHVIPTAAGSGNFVLDGYYTWSRIGTLALPALSGWTPFTASKALVAGDQYIEQVLSLATVVPPANAKYPSANLWVYLRRVSATDTYETNAPDGTVQANIVLAGADCHVRKSRAGTDGEWA